jgi:hypothetical protein
VLNIKTAAPNAQRGGPYVHLFVSSYRWDQYIPPIPAPPAGIGGWGSFLVATTDSVVSSEEATLVAF